MTPKFKPGHILIYDKAHHFPKLKIHEVTDTHYNLEILFEHNTSRFEPFSIQNIDESDWRPLSKLDRVLS